MTWAESITGRSSGPLRRVAPRSGCWRAHARGCAPEVGHQFLGELEPFRAFLCLARYTQLESAFEAVVAIGVLHQPYDGARVHLVLLLEQRVAPLGAEIESADS